MCVTLCDFNINSMPHWNNRYYIFTIDTIDKILLFQEYFKNIGFYILYIIFIYMYNYFIFIFIFSVESIKK